MLADIQCLTNSAARVDFTTEENFGLFRHIFEAKHVPLKLLAKIGDEREFHRPDWQSVVDSTTGALQDFDFYVDFIAGEAERLKALWMV